MSEYTELIERLCDLAAEIEDYEDSSLVCEAINAINELSRPTNADRIRSMTDEELGVVLLNQRCMMCDYNGDCDYLDECKEGIFNWLREEAT